jgi:hypothetical protein
MVLCQLHMTFPKHCFKALTVQVTGRAKHIWRVDGMTKDDANRRVARKQTPVWLDAAWDMNCFTVTVIEVNARLRSHLALPVDALPAA